MMGYGGYGLIGGLGMGLGIIFWIAIIALTVWAVARLANARTVAADDSPLEILKRRYARGEISQAEFERAKQEVVR